MNTEKETTFRFTASVYTAIETLQMIFAFLTPAGCQAKIKEISRLDITEERQWLLKRDRLLVGTERVLKVSADLNLVTTDEFGVCDKPSQLSLEFEIDKTKVRPWWHIGRYSYVIINGAATISSAVVFSESARQQYVHVLKQDDIEWVIRSVFSGDKE